MVIICQFAVHGQCHSLSGLTEGRIVKVSVAVRRSWTPVAEKPAGDVHALNLNDPWELICERAGLEDARIHDCRHRYASERWRSGRACR